MGLQLIDQQLDLPPLMVGDDKLARWRGGGVEERGDEAVLGPVAGALRVVERVADEPGDDVVAAPTAAVRARAERHQRRAVGQVVQRERLDRRRETGEEGPIPQHERFRADPAQQAASRAPLVDVARPDARVADGVGAAFRQQHEPQLGPGARAAPGPVPPEGGLGGGRVGQIDLGAVEREDASPEEERPGRGGGRQRAAHEAEVECTPITRPGGKPTFPGWSSPRILVQPAR